MGFYDIVLGAGALLIAAKMWLYEALGIRPAPRITSAPHVRQRSMSI